MRLSADETGQVIDSVLAGVSEFVASMTTTALRPPSTRMKLMTGVTVAAVHEGVVRRGDPRYQGLTVPEIRERIPSAKAHWRVLHRHLGFMVGRGRLERHSYRTPSRGPGRPKKGEVVMKRSGRRPTCSYGIPSESTSWCVKGALRLAGLDWTARRLLADELKRGLLAEAVRANLTLSSTLASDQALLDPDDFEFPYSGVLRKYQSKGIPSASQMERVVKRSVELFALERRCEQCGSRLELSDPPHLYQCPACLIEKLFEERTVLDGLAIDRCEFVWRFCALTAVETRLRLRGWSVEMKELPWIIQHPLEGQVVVD